MPYNETPIKENIMNTTATKKNFIYRHRVGLLTTALVITTGAAVIMRAGLKEKDDFLREHDLYETYYAQID